MAAQPRPVLLALVLFGIPATGSAVSVLSIGAGGASSCARVSGSAVKCWGYNGFGKLGLEDTANRGDAAGELGNNLPMVSLGTGRTATAIAIGGSHTCALLDNATVKCWGRNSLGQLGLGDFAHRGDAAGEMGDNLPAVSLGTGRTATAIAVGNDQACALLDNATVKCWGGNDFGQLGLEDVAHRGDAAGEMGDNLPAVSLGTGRTATAITAGGTHSCALLDNGTVKCWGYNGSGGLGLGDTVNRGQAAGQMGDNLAAVSLGTGRTATAIAGASGGSHTCAILDDATVKCWGLNINGNLGLGDTANRGVAAGEMGDNLPAVSLGTGRTATAIAAGGSHTCAVLDNATVKCWGNNFSGQLGLGDTALRGDAAGEMGDNLPAVSLGTGRTATAIDLGGDHTCALLDNATVKCWGFNFSGQLGLGDPAHRGDAAGEMGDSLPNVNLGNTLEIVSGNGQSNTAFQPLSAPFVVRIRDSSNNPVSGVTVTFAVTAGRGSLSATSVNTDGSGQASTTLTLGPSPGVYTVSASVIGLIASPQTFTATGVATPRGDLDAVRIVPNPFRPGRGHAAMGFFNLPANARVRIYTPSGELVKDLTASAAGLAAWDGTNTSGGRVSGGVYQVLAQGADRAKTFTVAVQR